MLSLYHSLTRFSTPVLRAALRARVRRGKENPARLDERMGKPTLPRPAGKLIWFHAASVGEAQSTLILINALLGLNPDLSVLVTTGTVTSAALMEQRLPPRTFHQFYPLDHPRWVEKFLNHWQPDMVLWMESELWPNMLRAIRERGIRCALINGRMSARSFRRWSKARKTITQLLTVFDIVLAQTAEDADYYHRLGAMKVAVRDNIKYSATPLPYMADDLAALKAAIGLRPVWLYASTHAGEETLALDLHQSLRTQFPDLLTIIVPRHPDRRGDIAADCVNADLGFTLRGDGKAMPKPEDGIYIADTLGELGLFYRFSPIACIGRTFSTDGGGGHNPIEAAQLGCAVLHGPLTQNLAVIFSEMDSAGAAICVNTPDEFLSALKLLLTSATELDALQDKGEAFAGGKSFVLETMIADLTPLLIDADILKDPRLCV